MRLVCFPFASAANSGFGFRGRVDGVVLIEGELGAGGGVVGGVCCATIGIATEIASKTSQPPNRAIFVLLLIGLCFDAEFRWRNETPGLNSGALHRNWHSWGIKLSRGKFNAPEE
jgi:hypothetical protein